MGRRRFGRAAHGGLGLGVHRLRLLGRRRNLPADQGLHVARVRGDRFPAGCRRHRCPDDPAHGHRGAHRLGDRRERGPGCEELLHPPLRPHRGRVRDVRVHRPVLPLLLLRTGHRADVPPHRGVGLQLHLRGLREDEGVRRAEARADDRRGERARLDSHHRHLRMGGHRHLRHPPIARRGAGRRTVVRCAEDAVPARDGRLRPAGWPLAVPHVVAGRPRRCADLGEHAARRRADEAGRVRHHPRRHDAAAGGHGGVGGRSLHPGHGQRGLRRGIGDVPDGPEVRRRLLQREPHGLRHHGHSNPGQHRTHRSDAPDVLPRHHDRPLLRRRRSHLRARTHA